jgi:long-chain fatty acid transport protein
MGGAGTAAPRDLLGAFFLNPAGLMAFDGTRVDVSFELFRPEATTSSSAGPGGSGTTASGTAYIPLPALGWSRRIEGQPVVLGLGAFAAGGFGVNYPSEPTNPIFAPRPTGFGQAYSQFQLLKFTPAVAVAPSEKLWLGFALNVDWGILSADPLPTASPDVDPGPDGTPGTPDDRVFYPRATAADPAWGFGFQAGVIYRPSATVSLGAAYTSKQRFQDFEFTSVHENPNLPNFGSPRTLTFSLDAPAVVAGGIAMSPLSALSLLGDVRYILYESADGFSESGFDETGAVRGLGWRNILVLALGAEYRASTAIALRGGYNRSQNPIPEELTMFNIPAPAILKDHLTLGIGVRPTKGFEISAAYYHAFKTDVEGPIVQPPGPIPGTSVAMEAYENSFLLQFSFGALGGGSGG